VTLYYFSLVLPAIGILLRLVAGRAADNFLLVLLICIAALLLGLKEIGADYYSYVDYIEYIQQSKSLDDVFEIVRDPAFYFIVKSTALISLSSGLVFFTIGILTLSGVAISLPTSLTHKATVFCLYLLFFGAGLNYEALRAGMGLAFFFLAGRLVEHSSRYVLALAATGSHLSLLLPVLSSISRWGNQLICRRPLLAVGLSAILSLVIPILFLVNERLLWYLNLGETDPSKFIIVLALQAIVYSSLTNTVQNCSATRSYLLSSAIITLCLSVAFSFYSEIAASRISEIGAAIFFMLVVQDFNAKAYAKISATRKLITYLILILFALELLYSYYIRFIATYEY
jgi:hypothetical protein